MEALLHFSYLVKQDAELRGSDIDGEEYGVQALVVVARVVRDVIDGGEHL